MGPFAALAEEWCKRKVAESPKWSHEKWRRIAAIHGIEYASDESAVVEPSTLYEADAAGVNVQRSPLTSMRLRSGRVFRTSPAGGE